MGRWPDSSVKVESLSLIFRQRICKNLLVYESVFEFFIQKNYIFYRYSAIADYLNTSIF